MTHHLTPGTGLLLSDDPCVVAVRAT